MTYLIQSSFLAGMVGTALIGGLLFAFSVCVMQALASVPAEEGMRVMQRINRVILNPLFFFVFMGTSLLSVVNVVVVMSGWGGECPITFVAASGVYLIGVFIVTAAGNVPMNNRLDALKPADGEEYWQLYLKNWTRLNHLRTAASTIAILLYGIGFIQINLPI